MVGETVTPDRNTHFWFNGIPGSLKGVEVPRKHYIAINYSLQDWLECAGKNWLTFKKTGPVGTTGPKFVAGMIFRKIL